MRKLFKERKLFKGGDYMRKYGIYFLFAIATTRPCVLVIIGSLKNKNAKYTNGSTTLVIITRVLATAIKQMRDSFTI